MCFKFINRTKHTQRVYLLHQSQRTRISDGRGGVGHRTHHRHSSSQSSGRTRREVLFMKGTGLPQVNMDINQTWEIIIIFIILSASNRQRMRGCYITYNVSEKCNMPVS